MRRIAFGFAAAAAAWSVPALAPVTPPICDGLGVPRRLGRGVHGVALTFDDGPHPVATPELLDILSQTGARATFFLIGQQVERWPGLVRRIANEGHEVAVHGYRHRNALRLTPRAFARDLERGWHAIAEASGRTPTLYRPPYGIFSPAALAVVRRRGLSPLLWSRWGHDWRRSATAERIAGELTHDLGSGDVLLLHDADHYSAPGSWRNTLAAMPRVLDELARQGLPAVTPEVTPRDRADPLGSHAARGSPRWC